MNARLHPVFLAALAPFAPPTQYRQFWIRTSRGSDFFPAMGLTRISVQKQHEGMCADGEQAVVLTDEEHFERVDAAMLADKSPEAQARRDWRHLQAQQQYLHCVGRL